MDGVESEHVVQLASAVKHEVWLNESRVVHHSVVGFVSENVKRCPWHSVQQVSGAVDQHFLDVVSLQVLLD